MAETVLITGASSGFGAALASRLAGLGYQIFGTSRRSLSSPEGVSMVQLDVDSDASVESCVRTVLERAGAIDVLVNNAGYVHTGALEELKTSDLLDIFNTNFFGVARMVKAVLPTMRERRSGRIINVSSLAGLMPIPFVGAYCASKHALESYSETLRHEVKPFGIHVSIVEPSFHRTPIEANGRRTAPAASPYSPWRDRMFAAWQRESAHAPAPRPVIDLLVRVIQAPAPRLRYPIGKFRAAYYFRGLTPEPLWELGVRMTWDLKDG